MRKSDFTPIRLFLICIVLSSVVLGITAYFYPTTSDFEKTTPTIIWLSGLIAGIGIPLAFKKTKKEITR